MTSLGGSIGASVDVTAAGVQLAVQRLQEADPAYPTVTPHNLRRTAASMSISAGGNVKAVQTMLGHASAFLTLVAPTYSGTTCRQVSAAQEGARMRAR